MSAWSHCGSAGLDAGNDLSRQFPGPPLGPGAEGSEQGIEFLATRCEAIAFLRMLDQVHFAQLLQSRIEDRRRNRFAALLQLAERAGSDLAEIPQHAQC